MTSERSTWSRSPQRQFGYPDSWLGVDRRRDRADDVEARLEAIESAIYELAERIEYGLALAAAAVDELPGRLP